MSLIADKRSRAPRVLYLPNETECGGENQQVGGRAAFGDMLADGTVSALSIYSFLAAYYTSGRNVSVAHQELLNEVTQFQPDIIFWSHPDDYPLTDELISAMRKCGCDPLLVYHEGDPFDRLYKRLGKPQRILYCRSDVFFTVGLGDGRRLFERMRVHRHLYHAPTYTERERFAQSAEAGVGAQFEAVMIGNIPKRLRIFRHPGSPERVRLARGLRKLFGPRFGCFGTGWPSDIHSYGPVRHTEQRTIIQTSRMSLMWEHFPEYSFYYSDRLAIALAAGVPFVTSARPGHDILFRNVPGLFHAATVQEALDIAIYLRSLSLGVVAELGAAARSWVLDNLEARVVFRRMFETCLDCYHSRMCHQGEWV